MKSIEKELTAARNKSTGVLSIFDDLLNRLEVSAKDALGVAERAKTESERLAAVRKDAEAHADEVFAKLEKLGKVFR